MRLRKELAVMKFGGTSIGTAEAMRGAARVVMAREGETVVVVSALSGVTDALAALGETALKNNDWLTDCLMVCARHEALAKELGVVADLSPYFSEIKVVCSAVAGLRELAPFALDRLRSFGERMSSVIFAGFLRASGRDAAAVDAFDLIATDDRYGSAKVNAGITNAQTRDVLSPTLARGVVPVVTGYIGRSSSGRYSTLGRGGSDYSAAVVAAALGAGELQIWTDVDGIRSADPRIVPSAGAIGRLSYLEAAELAAFGAKVLHPKTIGPVMGQNIPVRVLNTFNPFAVGTLVSAEEYPSVKAVSSKKGITMVTVEALDMIDARGFLAAVFAAFGRHGLSVDVLASSEASISVTVDRLVPPGLVEDLRAFSTVDVREGMAVACLVGGGIRGRTDVLRRLFASVTDVRVEMVSQGASARNVTFVVAEADADRAVRSVYREFFASDV